MIWLFCNAAINPLPTLSIPRIWFFPVFPRSRRLLHPLHLPPCWGCIHCLNPLLLPAASSWCSHLPSDHRSSSSSSHQAAVFPWKYKKRSAYVRACLVSRRQGDGECLWRQIFPSAQCAERCFAAWTCTDSRQTPIWNCPADRPLLLLSSPSQLLKSL